MHTNFVDVLIKRNIIYYLIFLSSIYSYLFFLFWSLSTTTCMAFHFFIKHKAEPRSDFFYCCAGWAYILAFTKILTMYQIYGTWIHPLLCLHLFPLIPEIGSTGVILYLHTFVHNIYTLFTFIHSFPITSPLLLVTVTPGQDPFHPPLIL
jgi:hypothetical protein